MKISTIMMTWLTMISFFSTSVFAQTPTPPLTEMSEVVQGELLFGNEESTQDSDEASEAEIVNEEKYTGAVRSNDILNVESLKIVGRGLKNRKTGDVIALACIGDKIPSSQEPSCKKMRHVKWDVKTKTLFLVGPEFHAGSVSEPSRVELKEVIKDVSLKVKENKKWLNRKQRGNWVQAFGLVTALGFGAVVISKDIAGRNGVGPGVSTGPFLLSWIGVMALIFGVQALVTYPIAGKKGVISKALFQQNGWNWSVNPRVVSAKSFHWLDIYLAEHSGN